MKKEIFSEVEIPEGMSFEIDGNLVRVSKGNDKLEREFNINKISIKQKDGKIIVGSAKSTKAEKRMTNTIVAHIKNMVKGLEEGFEYDLKIASSHFPMNVEVKEGLAVVKNFLGEKIPREVKIPKDVTVEIDKDLIKVKSNDKELAGQTAANFEQSTKIRSKDRRIFQDGIFIINKSGKEI